MRKGHVQFFKKGTRAYTLTLEQDLLGDWVIRRSWGPLTSPFARTKVEVFLNPDQAERRFKALAHQRVSVRGYTLHKKRTTA